MKRAVLTAAIVLASAGVAMAAAQAPAEYHELLNNYCVTCHNQAAGIPDANPLYLDLADLADPVQDAEIWENVIRKTGVGAMPPLGMPAPDRGELAEFRLWLATTLDIANAELNDPGRKLIHRLNRVEYGNAIRDMLDIEMDMTELLPSDGGDFGFDNIAAALTTSPLLLERYLTAALRISTAAVGDTEVAPGATTFNIAMEVSQEQHMEGLPLGTRGGGKVLYNFPADGEYQFSGVLLRTVAEGYVGVEGHETPHEFVIMIDGEVVYSAELGGPEDHEAHGEDILAIRTVLDERMSTRVPVTAGPHEVVFSFTERPASEQDVWQPAIRSSQEVHFTSGPPRLERMIIEGPYEVTGISDTPSRDRLFVCRPASDASADEAAACANEILSNVARRAFRRPVTEADLVEPLGFYRSARVSGGDFDAGIRSGLALILASPSFVFRVERDPADLLPGAPHDISEVELASRMSFFLWSSIPDDELLNLAIAGQLRAPGVLEAQIQRMVADRRTDAMVSDFTGQWLQLRTLERIAPDILLYPEFDDNLRQAFRQETELFFASILRENRSTLSLLDADYTFVNERLARHYGIPGVYGNRFRRIDQTDSNRYGLLGHGSILSITSASTRTSPVIRGKYILTNLFNSPPPLPPPNVPALEVTADAEDAPTTVRGQLELHRANPACASCHATIDPVGFALEGFNGVGQWRDVTRDGQAIDSSGILMDGTSVNGPVELREAILARPDVFSGLVTEKMLIYALGRGLEPTDMSVVRSIVADAAENDFRLMSIIVGIVKSSPFQMRTKPEPSSEQGQAVETAQTREE